MNPSVFPSLPADRGMCRFVSSPERRRSHAVGVGDAAQQLALFSYHCTGGILAVPTAALRDTSLSIQMKTNIWQPTARCWSDPCNDGGERTAAPLSNGPLQSPSSGKVQKHNKPHLGDGERLTCCPVSAFYLMEGRLFIAAMSVGVGSRPGQRNNASPQWDQ